MLELYTGHLISDLDRRAEEAIQASRDFRAKTVLQNAYCHLKGHHYDEDEIAAEVLSELMFCLESRLTRICYWCQCMEGMHSKWINACPVQPWNPTAALSRQFLPYPDQRRA